MEESSCSQRQVGLATMADQELQRVLEALQQREREVEKLRTQLKEVLHINHQWDVEYRELQQKFEQYQLDVKIPPHHNAHSCSEEDEELLERERREEELTAELDSTREELRHVKENKERLEKKLSDARIKYDSIKHNYDEAVKVKVSLAEQLKQLQHHSRSTVGSSTSQESSKLVQQLKEEVSFLHQQLKVYQEDFEAERRDRQRMVREKDLSKIHCEAEITSLKLQLDRCKGELTRFQMEANRLGQQLRLRRQAEQEQFRKHLENKGYAPRYPNQPLPPLDPYVENDIPSGGYHSPPPQQRGGTRYNSRVGSASSDTSPTQFRRIGPILLQSRDSQQELFPPPPPPPPLSSSQLVVATGDTSPPPPPPPPTNTHHTTTTTTTPKHSFHYSCPKCHQDGLCNNCA